MYSISQTTIARQTAFASRLAPTRDFGMALDRQQTHKEDD
jgi:hypothetical protein